MVRFVRLNLMILDSSAHSSHLYELTWILVNSSYFSLPSIHNELLVTGVY